MAGPGVKLRAINYGRTEQVKIKTLLKRIAIIDIEEEDKFEFCFKKGKTLGMYLKNNSCNFLVNINIKETEDESSKADIETKLKDKPAAFILISAMCNQKEDHFLLANFALEINKIVGGFINLLGAIISPLLKDEKGNFIHHTKRDEENYVNAIKGTIHEIGYAVDENRNYYYHVVNREWFINWMEHDDFRMIK
jgi:Family of unknown function (DUF6368)